MGGKEEGEGREGGRGGREEEGKGKEGGEKRRREEGGRRRREGRVGREGCDREQGWVMRTSFWIHQWKGEQEGMGREGEDSHLEAVAIVNLENNTVQFINYPTLSPLMTNRGDYCSEES